MKNVIQTRDNYTDTSDEATNAPLSKVTGTGAGEKFGLDVTAVIPGGTGASSAAEAFRAEFVVDDTSGATPDYSIGDQIGSAVEITNAARQTGGGGKMEHVSVINHNNAAIDIALYFFRDEPTSAVDNNAALAITEADAENFLYALSFGKGRFFGIGSALASMQTNYRYQCDATSLWVVAQAITETAFGSTDDLHIVLGLTKD